MMIHASGTTTVSADLKTVFEYISNLENDKQWRKEINATTMSSSPQINARAVEDSFLSKRTPSNILHLICTAYADNDTIVYQTAPDSTFYLKSTRQVEALGPRSTRITYTIEFDKSIVKHGLGFSLPSWLVQMVASKDMRQYLARLKAVIEQNAR